MVEFVPLMLGDEKVRIGRGRAGGCMVTSEVELELEDEDMTEAFLLRSARLCWTRGCSSWGAGSGEGAETWISGIRGQKVRIEKNEGNEGVGRGGGEMGRSAEAKPSGLW